MVRPLPPMKLTGSSGTLGWRDPGHLRRVSSVLGIFKDVRFYPILNFGLFWAPLFSRCFYPLMNFGHFWAPPFFKVSVFYPTRFFRQFWADATFSAVRRTFLAEEKAHNLEFLPHPKFWPFFGRPLKDVLEFSKFWAGFVATHSVHCLLCLITTKEDKQYSPCLLVKTSPAERPATFSPKNSAYERSGVL